MYRHSRCNQCRAYEFERRPSTVRKRGYVQRAKANPCVDCAQVFPTECMHLVHITGVRKFNVTSAWRWHSEDDVADELKKCVPVCANCKRLRNRPVREAKRQERLILAETQRAIVEAPSVPH